MKKSRCALFLYLDTEHMGAGSDQFWRKIHVVLNVVFSLVWIRHVSGVWNSSFNDSTGLAGCFNTQLIKQKEKAVKEGEQYR